MKLLKLGIISLVLLFVLATAIGALLPSHVLVSRAVNIHAPDSLILQEIAAIPQWKHWMKGMDDSLVKIQSDHQAQIGKSQVMITQITDSTVTSEWSNRKGASQTSIIRVLFQPQQEISIVQWQFEQKVGWLPWEKLGSIMNDKILGPMMEQNLEQLRVYIERGKLTP